MAHINYHIDTIRYLLDRLGDGGDQHVGHLRHLKRHADAAEVKLDSLAEDERRCARQTLDECREVLSHYAIVL
ncbi:MAG: hypothetical protein UHD09_02430 [Bifidobacterium sp.]|nr:hypothetical protein [Bifidobacterium sp.]